MSGAHNEHRERKVAALVRFISGSDAAVAVQQLDSTGYRVRTSRFVHLCTLLGVQQLQLR